MTQAAPAAQSDAAFAKLRDSVPAQQANGAATDDDLASRLATELARNGLPSGRRGRLKAALAEIEKSLYLLEGDRLVPGKG